MNGNALPIKVRQLLQQVGVLHQHRAPRPCSEAVLIIGYGDAKGRGQGLFLLGQGLPPSLLGAGLGCRAALIGLIRYLEFGLLLFIKYDSLELPEKIADLFFSLTP